MTVQYSAAVPSPSPSPSPSLSPSPSPDAVARLLVSQIIIIMVERKSTSSCHQQCCYQQCCHLQRNSYLPSREKGPGWQCTTPHRTATLAYVMQQRWKREAKPLTIVAIAIMWQTAVWMLRPILGLASSRARMSVGSGGRACCLSSRPCWVERSRWRLEYAASLAVLADKAWGSLMTTAGRIQQCALSTWGVCTASIVTAPPRNALSSLARTYTRTGRSSLESNCDCSLLP